MSFDPSAVIPSLSAGLEHHHAGRLEAAEAVYRALLTAAPDDPDALNLLAAVLLQRGQTEDALPLLRRAAAVAPDHPGCLNNLVVALRRLGLRAEAAGVLERLIGLTPDIARLWADLGHLRFALGAWRPAADAFGRAATLDPADALSLQNQGVSLAQAGDDAGALACAQAALARAPDQPAFQAQLGVALANLQRFAEAEAAFRQALAGDPDNPTLATYLGGALARQNRHDAAAPILERVLAAHPGHVEALHNMGVVQVDLDQPQRALALFDRALALQPVDGETRFARASLLLRGGDFVQGWADYARCWGGPSPLSRLPPLRQPIWRGGPVDGLRLLVHADQGLGDAIMFARFLMPLEALGARLLIGLPGILKRLFNSLPVRAPRLVEDETLPDFDAFAPISSLPGIFGINAGNIPVPIPYLRAEPERVARWAQRIADGSDRLRVGITWRGKSDPNRDIPLTAFAALALPGVRLICLQKGLDLDEIAQAMALGIEMPTGLDEGPDAFIDSAALVMNLDLVVSSDTAIVHLAGALGRPAWVMLRKVAEWRWLTGRTDTPWYPSLRLFRQDRLGDWPGAFAEAAGELRRMAADGGLRRMAADEGLRRMAADGGLRRMAADRGSLRS